MSQYTYIQLNDPLGLADDLFSEVWDLFDFDVIQNYVTRSTETIDGLANVQVKAKFIWLWKQAFTRGILPLFYSGKRTFQKQYELYLKYLSDGKYRAVAPGFSYHNFGLAVDTMVIDPENLTKNLPGGVEQLQQVNLDFDLGLHNGAAYGDKGHFADKTKSLKELQQDSQEFKQWQLDHPEEVETIAAIKQELSFLEKNRNWLIPLTIASFTGIIIFILYKIANSKN